MEPCDSLREDYEAYALGAVDPATGRRIAEHIRECDECAQVVRAYKVAVDYLALAVPLYRPSARLRERIMGGVGAFRPPIYTSLLRRPWLAGAAASLLIAFAVGAIVWAVILSSQVSKLRDDNAHLAELAQLDTEQRDALLQLESALNSARNEQIQLSSTLAEQGTLLVLALDPDLIPTDLQGTSLAPQARCSYVWSSKQSVGAMTCKDLPQTSFALNYELWVTKGDKTVPLGAFLAQSNGTAQMLVKFPADTEGPISNMWVTLESQSASRQKPSSDVVLQRAPVQQAAR